MNEMDDKSNVYNLDTTFRLLVSRMQKMGLLR